jgi:hypothetical protein
MSPVTAQPSAPALRPGRRAAWALLLTAAVWLVVAWPLPRYVFQGIPSSATNTEQPAARRMIQGDHLQVLYSYWLFSDMLAGQSPWFHNVYEFNTGNDAERRYVGFDELPLGLVFAAGRWTAGRAFGWNLAGFAALWITLLFTWLLARRYTPSEPAAAAVAAVSIAVPFRWAGLLGGSPAGLAMAWVPLLLWGVDTLVRHGRLSGSLAAAAALLFASWNDTYVFFFSMLLAPCWAAVALLHEESFPWRAAREWGRRVAAGLPLLAVAGALVVVGQMKKSGFEATTSAAGRSLREIALFSPHARGFVAWRDFGADSSVYVGVLLPAALLAGLAAALWLALRRPRAEWRAALTLAALVAGAAGALLLALGTNGPADGRLFLAARKLVPPYEFVRQPAKVLVVLPPLAAVALGLALAALARAVPFCGRRAAGCAAVAALLIVADYTLQVRPTVCLLDTQQPAYRAVAEDARRAGNPRPHALVLPIWPGDSSWASLYEHYVSLYRIRMLNGYQPMVSRRYVQDIYEPLDSANSGLLTNAQLADLTQRGVDYVLLHEDAFPEQVSQFPVAFTLRRLLAHPRLALLAQGGNVWAFRIRPAPAPHALPAAAQGWSVWFPNFHYEFEWARPREEPQPEGAAASGDRYVRLAAAGDRLEVRKLEHLQTPDASLLLRLRGQGELKLDLVCNDGSFQRHTVVSEIPEWHWQAVPAGDLENSRWLDATLAWRAGRVDADLLIFASGVLPELEPGAEFALPAPLFFHAGHTDLERNAVVLQPDRQPADRLFYGPKLPLAPGRYRLELRYETDAPAGTRLGAIRVQSEKASAGPVTVIAGQPAALAWDTTASDLPFEFGFEYARTAVVRLLDLRIRREP